MLTALSHLTKRSTKLLGPRRLAGIALTLALWPAAIASAQEYRPIDEVGNNEANPSWGSSEQPLIRKAALDYADGISEPNGQNRPNARLISLTLCQQDTPIPAKRATTDFLWAFGVFVNHDMDITEGGDAADLFNIDVPEGDPYFDPAGTGTQQITMIRGKYVDGTGTSTDNPRLLDNSDTAYLDLSTVYGSNDDRAMWLRSLEGGKLRVTEHPVGDLLPFNDGTQFNLGNFELDNRSSDLFVAGDVRCNVSAFLASMHTLFVRNHNYWAQKIAEENTGLDDETLYQRARRRNIAEFQNIALNQWLPTLLGQFAVPEYEGYDAEANASVDVEFSTVILRGVGHTLLPTTILRLDANGNTVPAGNILLRDSFFDNAPLILQSTGLDPIMRGLASKRCQESDPFFVDDMHHFLFTLPGAGGRDIVALNIQRARDFGIPDYNSLREAYGLARKVSFFDVTKNVSLAVALQSLYGSVDDVDPFIGAVCEDHYGTGSVGELIHTGMLDQLTRIRNGDRYWFEAEGNFSADELTEIHATKLSDIIKRNTGVTNIQDDVFFIGLPYLGDAVTGVESLCGVPGVFGVSAMLAALVGLGLARRRMNIFVRR